jgi:hypothetical protein
MDITYALQSLRPKAEWSLNGDTYSGLEWLDTTQTKPTEEEVEAEIARLQIEHKQKEYQRQRAPEYPSIGDQLDALFHAGVFPSEMAAQIQAIKDRYPKPEVS